MITKITPITPSRNPFLTGGELRSAIYAACNDAADEVKKKYERAWQTWDHKPEATVNKSSGYERTVEVTGPNAVIFSYVDQGTKPHIIRAKNRRTLAFGSVFSPKSIPDNLVARKGEKGGDTIFRRMVMHPGSKPRNITKRINEKSEKVLSEMLRKHVRFEGYVG